MEQPVRPTVLILGGFLTAPPIYRPWSPGASRIAAPPAWSWRTSGRRTGCSRRLRGTGPLATRSAAALVAAIRMSREGSSGAPVLVVGHSAGGITGRLLTAPEPFPGRRFGAAAHIGAIVSLGTPHRLATGEGIGRRLNEVAAFGGRVGVPGAYWAPRSATSASPRGRVVGDPAR